MTSAADEQAEDEDYVPDVPAVTAAKKIVQYMSRAYDPDSYPNPALNFHYETLAAICMNEPMPEQTDKTIPYYATIDKRVGKYVAQLKEAIGHTEGGVDTSEDEGKPAKRAREEASDEDLMPWVERLREKGQKANMDVRRRDLLVAHRGES